MYIDIHRHSINKGKANICLINLFNNQATELLPHQIYSLGLHPWYVNANTLVNDIEEVKYASENQQIIAIGETGLDKKIITSFELQMEAFKKQIEVAINVNKPMIIHCVRAYNEILEAKKAAGKTKPWLIHWYNADIQMALQLIKKGFYLSFGHMLFNETSKAFKAFPKIPLEYIFFETDDAGYEIDEIYKRASDLLGIPISQLEKQIEINFETFFGFKA
jgi:TatD DNase family protein